MLEELKSGVIVIDCSNGVHGNGTTARTNLGRTKNTGPTAWPMLSHMMGPSALSVIWIHG